MNKLVLMVVGLLLSVGTVFGQNIAFDKAPDTVSVKAVGLRNLSKNESDQWRAGLALPFLNIRDGMGPNKPVVSTGDIWILTDAKAMRNLYLGAGLDTTLYQKGNFRAGATVGWSADFSNLEHIKRGSWGIGASLNWRF